MEGGVASRVFGGKGVPANIVITCQYVPGYFLDVPFVQCLNISFSQKRLVDFQIRERAAPSTESKACYCPSAFKIQRANTSYSLMDVDVRDAQMGA